jgi:hypothetical protein
MSAHRKGILNVDRAQRGEYVFLECCWDDCDRTAVTLHRAMFHDHNRYLRCDDARSTHLWYTFCSDRHLQLFRNSHHAYGKLATGSRGLIS